MLTVLIFVRTTIAQEIDPTPDIKLLSADTVAELPVDELRIRLVPVELDVPTNPMDVGIFRTSAVMADPQDSDQVIVEPGRGLSWKQPQRLCSLACRRHRVPPVPAPTSHFLAILAASCGGIQVPGKVGIDRT